MPETKWITLTDLCTETKVAPRVARAKLRAAAKDAEANPNLAKGHASRQPWRWEAGSAALNEAKKAIAA